MDAAQSMQLLAELFDVMDAIATEHGVERIKTFGEQLHRSLRTDGAAARSCATRCSPSAMRCRAK